MDADAEVRAARATKGSPFLTAQQAAFYLAISTRTLQAYRSLGKGPRYRRHCRRVLYHIDDIDAWSRDVAPKDICQ